MVEENFIKMPKNLIMSKEGGIIMKLTYGAEALGILLYIETFGMYLGDNNHMFTFSEMIETLGLKPTKGKGKTIDKFRTSLVELQELGILSNSNKNLSKISPKDVITLKINYSFDKNEYGEDSLWFKMFYTDIETICSKAKPNLIIKCLVADTLIRARQVHSSSESKGGVEATAGVGSRPECSQMSWSFVSNSLCSVIKSHNTWDKVINELEDIKLIYTTVKLEEDGTKSSKIYAYKRKDLNWVNNFKNPKP